MVEEENLAKRSKRKEHPNKSSRKGRINMSKRSSFKHKNLQKGRGHGSASKDCFGEGGSSNVLNKDVKTNKSLKRCDQLGQKTTSLRKTIDPETTKYFAEVANLFQSNEIDLEELSTICNNALEETRGKEVELATDMTISHTLQNLLADCDLDRLCGFLRNSSKGFVSIATDKFGSHVAETAFKSLAKHLGEEGSYSYVDETLSKLCQVMIPDVVSVMSNRYGSHVLRSLLCLCKGVPLNSLEEFHVTKRQVVLAERLNTMPVRSGGSNFKNFQYGFPVTFKFLVSEMLNHAKDEIKTLRVDKYSSFVLQTALKLSVGDDQALLHAIPILLGSDLEAGRGKLIGISEKQEIMDLLEDTASSHLLEVIIEVAPETLYSELLAGAFKGSLFDVSSHQCGNFVVQALVSSARTKDQMDLIWKELGPKFKELLELGKPGVTASMLATCERLQTHLLECCQALSAAVSSDSDSPSCIVPHVLFLESYFRDKSSWEWPPDDKMHVLGCVMLQIIFRCPKNLIQPYVTSLTSMDEAQIFQIAKDPGGCRIIEAFLCCDISTKMKLKVITKLQGHYGELAIGTASSFTVEKCFASSNISLKQTIATELLTVRAELSRTKHGPYLLKKLDIDGFASRPDQWKLSQESKESAYKEFHAVFGSKSESQERNTRASWSSQKSSMKTHRTHAASDNPDNSMTRSSLESPGHLVSMAKLGFPRKEKDHASKVRDRYGSKFIRKNSSDTSFVRSGKRKSSSTDLADLADLAGKSRLSAGEVQQLFKPSVNGNEKVPFLKKQKR